VKKEYPNSILYAVGNILLWIASQRLQGCGSFALGLTGLRFWQIEDKVKLPRAILADDHTILLEALRKLLETKCDVTGTATNGRTLLQMARVQKPDLVVLEVTMPILNGLEAARQLKSDMPEVKIIFLTVHEDPDIAREALHLGASGYLLKNSTAKELFKAIRDAFNGRTYISPSIVQRMERSFIRDPWESGRPKCLTPRQREVVQLLAEGKTMKEVADLLHVVPRTVAFHKYRVMEELELKTNAGLLQFAIKNHMVA
jgi:DNA-binding NarL/FixJ family response regulator